MLLIKSVVNGDVVWIWWIRKHRLSLDVVELENFITVLSLQDWGASNNILFVWLESLLSFEIISFSHGIVVHIIEETWVVSEALVPSQEGVVELGRHHSSIPKLIGGNRRIHQVHVVVLDHALVEAAASPGAAQSLVHSVLVGTPHVLQSLVNLVLIHLLSHVGWGKKPENHVLSLQFVES